MVQSASAWKASLRGGPGKVFEALSSKGRCAVMESSLKGPGGVPTLQLGPCLSLLNLNHTTWWLCDLEEVT